MRALVYILKVVLFVLLYHVSVAVLAGVVLFLGEPGAIEATRQAALLGAAMWGIFLLLGVITGYAAHYGAGGGAITGALVGTAYAVSIEVPFYFAHLAAGSEPAFASAQALRTASVALTWVAIIGACAAGGLIASRLARRRAMAQEAEAGESDDDRAETLPPAANPIQSVD